MKNRAYILMLAALLVPGAVLQGQNSNCPGFRNPTSFTTGSSDYFWTARVGQRVSQGASTGYTIYSTCAASNCPDITGNANITSTTYNTGSPNDGGVTCCGDGNIWDANDKRFQIITSANAGLDQFTINNGTGMNRIPEGYATSIRLGDPNSGGSASNDFNWSSGSNKTAEALFYTMYVTTENALLIINYAVVGRCYSHQPAQAGEFLIRVVKQNDNGTWPNTPINDSMWFRISAPPIPASGVPDPPWQMGRPGNSCGSTTCAYVYKPWTKVAVSLSKYLYKNVRIEMYNSDCIYAVDPIYAYISGDFQPMRVSSTGCPSPESGVIDTLSAPAGMISYQWFVTEEGAEFNTYDLARMDTVPFRQVYPATGTTTDHRFTPRLEDFILSSGPSAGDTVGVQTFMCVMTSALDPNKPFVSRLYANVENRKPMLRHTYETDCNGGVTFHNQSVSYCSDILNPAATYWAFYADTACTQLLDTMHGDDPYYVFPAAGEYGVTLYCETSAESGTACGSLERFTVRAVAPPPAGLSLSEHVSCDGDTVWVTCTQGCDLEKQWSLDGEPFIGADTMAMVLPLGRHGFSLTTVSEEGCTSTVSDTVNIFGVPSLSLGSNVDAVCLGDSLVLAAAGDVAYTWHSSPTDSSLVGQEGSDTVIVSPRETTVYYLEASTDNPCARGGSSVRIEVVPYPVPQVRASVPSVSVDRPTVDLADVSSYRASTHWTFSDGSSADGTNVSHTFTDFSNDSVGIAMHTCNRLDCCADTAVTLPVYTFSIWFANTFMPDGEGVNSRFGVVSSHPLLEYEISIFNRLGQLVFHSDDPNELWDGCDTHGTPCPQGAYAYTYRYAKDSRGGYHTGKGTVTLLR